MTSKLMPNNDEFEDIEKERFQKEKELRDKKHDKILVILGLGSISIGIGGTVAIYKWIY